MKYDDRFKLLEEIRIKSLNNFATKFFCIYQFNRSVNKVVDGQLLYAIISIGFRIMTTNNLFASIMKLCKQLL